MIRLGVLLSYLVPSRARRRLLQLLWGEGTRDSVSGLARQAQVSFAAAHRELAAMRAAGLARAERSGADLVYRANPAFPRAGLVRRLVREDASHSVPPPVADGEKVRGWLARAGAPLLVSRVTAGVMPPLEDVLGDALALSHHDATVARVLPLLLVRDWDRLDHGGLVRAATRRNERQALGLFLDLGALLGPNARMAELAESLRDRRRTRLRPFFARAHGPRALALARRRTPRLVRSWGYLMNMDLASFASVFAKHGEAA